MGLISLIACEKPIKSRPVVLEVVNPHTGEILKRDDKIDLPPEGTHVEIKIKDKETNVYLTDDDFPDNTIEETYSVAFRVIDDEGFSQTWGK